MRLVVDVAGFAEPSPADPGKWLLAAIAEWLRDRLPSTNIAGEVIGEFTTARRLELLRGAASPSSPEIGGLL